MHIASSRLIVVIIKGNKMKKKPAVVRVMPEGNEIIIALMRENQRLITLLDLALFSEGDEEDNRLSEYKVQRTSIIKEALGGDKIKNSNYKR